MTLKKFIKESEEVRKIFGKKEIEIIIKQLGGIFLTQSEKNRLSRDIRPKFKVIKELSQFEDEFELKKDAETMKIVEKAKEVILTDQLKEKINSIMLFGSHVKNEVSPLSDIDVCVSFSNISKEDAFQFRIRVMRELPEKVDIQVFNELPEKIKKDIEEHHRTLYKKREDEMRVYGET